MASIAAVMCLLSVFSVYADETAQLTEASEAEVTEAADSADTAVFSYGREAGLLEALGIVEDGAKDFSEEVQRGEFIRAVMKLCGYEYTGVGIIPPFSDIKETDRFYAAVSSAYALGYISGSGEFNAKEKVTLNEAADILTSVLGYKYVAGYYDETNSLIAAQKIGLLKGIKVSASNLTKSDMIKMLYNSLFIKMMEPKTYYSDGSYELENGVTILKDVFEAEEASGLVEATPITSLYAEAGCDNGFIQINDYLYYTDDEWNDFIGHTVKYYYTLKDSTPKIVYMCDKYDDVTFSVDFDDVNKLRETKLEYSRGRKNSEKAIKKNASFIYNGKLKSFSLINTDIKSGSVTLIDSDGNGTYDVVSITEYIHGLVSGIDVKNQKIHTSDNKVYTLKTDGEDRLTEIYLDGELVDFSEIKIDDIISVAEGTGKGNDIIRVYISRNTVEGSITGIKDKKVVIDDTEYPFDSKSFTPHLGDYGKFYIAVNGKVVYGKLENYVVYGFLYKMADGDGLSPAKVKIYSDKDRWVELDLKDKITFNGVRTLASSVIGNEKFLDDDGQFVPQLVTYRVNSKNELTVLNTAKAVARWSDAEAQARENAEFRQNVIGTDKMNFRATGNAFNMVAFINTSTYVFVIPGTEVGGKFEIDDDDIHLENVSNFVGDSQYGPLKFYDMDEWGNAKALVVYGDTAKLDANIYPVTDVGSVMDSNGNVVNSISIIYNGYELTFEVSDSVTFSRRTGMSIGDLKKGDVIRYGMGKSGKVGIIEPYINDSTDKYVLTNGIYSSQTFVTGDVERIDTGDIKKVQLINGSDKYILDISAVSAVYRYNTKKEEVQISSVSEIPPGVHAVMSVRYGRVQQIVYYD